MFGLSHRCPPWLHRVPSVKLLWGERAHPVAGGGCVRCLQCPAGALGSLAPWPAALGSLAPWAAPTARACQGTGAGLQGGMGRGQQGCRRGTRAGATSGIAGRQLEHGGGGSVCQGGHCTRSRLQEEVSIEPSCCPLQGSSRWLAETMGMGPQGAHHGIPSPCCSTLEQGTTQSCCCLGSRLGARCVPQDWPCPPDRTRVACWPPWGWPLGGWTLCAAFCRAPGA